MIVLFPSLLLKFSSAIVPVGKWITMRMELEQPQVGRQDKVLGDFGDGVVVTLISMNKHSFVLQTAFQMQP